MLAKALSIEDVYQWAQRFIAREWRLLLPVVFAFMALPGLIFALPWLQASANRFTAAVQAKDLVTTWAILRWLIPVGLFVFLIAAFGGLVVSALALFPSISVREAIGLAARRIGVLVGSLLLVLFGEMALTLVLTIILGLLRVNQAGVQVLISAILVCLGVFFGVRLLPLGPMVVRRRIGPVSALRETWLLTRGLFWRILAAAAIYLAGSMVVMFALSTTIGSLLLMLGKTFGVAELSQVLNEVFQQALGALVALGFHLLAAGIFRQLDGSTRGV